MSLTVSRRTAAELLPAGTHSEREREVFKISRRPSRAAVRARFRHNGTNKHSSNNSVIKSTGGSDDVYFTHKIPTIIGNTARKNHNKSIIMDCKLFSRSHCRKLLYLPRPLTCGTVRIVPEIIVTTQLQYCFVNYFHNIFGTMVQYFLQSNVVVCVAVYIDAGMGVTNPVTLTFVTSGPSFPRNWKVKICQIPCSSTYRGRLYSERPLSRHY